MKTLDDVLEHFGGPVKLGAALGISHQAVSQWRDGIPVGRAYQIEVLTKGKFKAKNLPCKPQNRHPALSPYSERETPPRASRKASEHSGGQP